MKTATCENVLLISIIEDKWNLDIWEWTVNMNDFFILIVGMFAKSFSFITKKMEQRGSLSHFKIHISLTPRSPSSLFYKIFSIHSYFASIWKSYFFFIKGVAQYERLTYLKIYIRSFRNWDKQTKIFKNISADFNTIINKMFLAVFTRKVQRFCKDFCCFISEINKLKIIKIFSDIAP